MSLAWRLQLLVVAMPALFASCLGDIAAAQPDLRLSQAATQGAPVSDGGDDAETDDPAAPLAPSGPLRIASWHLEDARTAGALVLLPDPDRAWRHTFGAERQTAPTMTFDAASLDADVVLLQGVRRVSDARALFPAREWRLIVSRQMLSPVLAPRPANRFMLDEVVPERPATTAVAVRFRRGLRVGGQVHLTEVVVPVEVPAGTAAARETPAALAVRVLVDRKPMWVVSVDLAAACARSEASGAQPCPAFEALRRWRTEASRSLPVIIGGTTTRGGAACSHQSLAVIESSLLFPAENAAAIGCVARMRWP